MASRDGRFVCSVHAGWRGAASGIIENSLDYFRRYDVPPEEVIVAIGPHIHACCYEVSVDFYQTLLTLPARELTKRYSDRLFHQRSEPFVEAQKASARGEDNLWFDLRAFAQLLLRRAGLCRRISNGWATVPTVRRNRLVLTGGVPTSRQRRRSSIRGLCARPDIARTGRDGCPGVARQSEVHFQRKLHFPRVANLVAQIVGGDG